MRRNLLALDLLLVALCAVGVWRFTTYKTVRVAEQTAFLKRREPAVATPVVLMPPPVQPAAAGTYIKVAQELLLSADRNPSVILDVVPPKQMPPLPRAYGAMDFGGGPQVMLSEKPGGRQRPYAPGDKIGEFEVVTFTRRGVVFGWDGKQVAATFEELKDTAAAQVAQAAPAPQAPSSSTAQPQGGPGKPPEVRSITSGAAAQGKPGPGDGPTRSCLPGDNAPPGTVAEGYRKVKIDMPMGSGCVWEKVQ